MIHLLKFPQYFKKIFQEKFWQNKLTLLLLSLNLIFNLLLWFAAIFIYFVKVGSGIPLVPTHYLIFSGIDRLGTVYGLFSFPALGLFIFLLNVTVGFLVYEKEKIISLLLLISSLLSQALILIALVLLNFVI